ncbi:MAG TPA: OpgC domain-containing protein [Candidatus Krumholzibacteria bacterium]|nr:OpgC domain-containing protein [Candidatus Krumholzibacteria bacterium]HPD70936.1 OpgC domain-containing protein [Candidatus Krumholzibacteria bacterium]HRY39364.1 OpgC domain-containing protein [Candidatus Krumholzibacteria bacterium]
MATGRFRSLDTLRGLMLVVMTVDHLDLFGPIYRFTYETIGFASAAEGFVLLSGMVAGVVYGGYAATPGLLGAKVRRRLVTLYGYHLVVVAGLGAYYLLDRGQRPAGGVAAALWNTLGGALLVNQEPPLDILPLYLLFVASLPLVIRSFQSGRAGLLLASSGALWGLDQLLTPLAGYPVELRFTIAGVPVFWQPNHFHLLAWQLLFVAGAWCGWRAREGTFALARPAPWPVVGAALACVAVGFGLRHGVGLPQLGEERLATGRVNLGWLRLIDVALVAWVAAQVVHRWPRLLWSRWLELLGRHALAVFTWQSLLQMHLGPVYLAAAERWGVGARLPILAGAVASLTLPAWLDERRRLRARRGDRRPDAARRP